jgi:hypothetical protein
VQRNVLTSQLGLPIDRTPLSRRANRAGLARPSALTYWLACARVQGCAATYCGGKLTNRSRTPASATAAVLCAGGAQGGGDKSFHVAHDRHEESQKRRDGSNDNEMADTTIGRLDFRIRSLALRNRLRTRRDRSNMTACGTAPAVMRCPAKCGAKAGDAFGCWVN